MRDARRQAEETGVVSARLTAQERRLLRAAATAEGATVSALVRRLALSGAQQVLAQRLAEVSDAGRA